MNLTKESELNGWWGAKTGEPSQDDNSQRPRDGGHKHQGKTLSRTLEGGRGVETWRAKKVFQSRCCRPVEELPMPAERAIVDTEESI